MSIKPVTDTKRILTDLEARCRKADYSGWDPFDGLMSGVFRTTPLRHWPLARLAWIQFFKRSPINLRPLLMVTPSDNAKGLALFSMGYGQMGQHDRQTRLVERLVSLRKTPDRGEQNHGWGYPFDWQSRAFYVPKGTPNVICTAYVVQALRQHEAGTGADHSEIIAEAGRFVMSSLLRSGNDTYVAYVPQENTFVHNANLWGAYVLAEASRVINEMSFADAASRAVESTIRAQAQDGSWPYGTRGHHSFIDSFHTGYNLQALHKIGQLLPSLDLSTTVQSGLDYYTKTFFSANGMPGYYSTTPWPIDCHSAAQAILTLIEVAPNNRTLELASRILRWTTNHMWTTNKAEFAYQKTTLGRNNIAYMRWTQAWMFLALAAWQTSQGNLAKNAGDLLNKAA